MYLYLISAYELYLDNLRCDWKNRSRFYKLFHTERQSEEGLDKVKKLCAQFKQTLSHKEATVHFIGIW